MQTMPYASPPIARLGCRPRRSVLPLKEIARRISGQEETKGRAGQAGIENGNSSQHQNRYSGYAGIVSDVVHITPGTGHLVALPPSNFEGPPSAVYVEWKGVIRGSETFRPAVGVEIRNGRGLREVRACNSRDCGPTTRWTSRKDRDSHRARRYSASPGTLRRRGRFQRNADAECNRHAFPSGFENQRRNQGGRTIGLWTDDDEERYTRSYPGNVGSRLNRHNAFENAFNWLP